MKKAIDILLTNKDEEAFSYEIKKVFPATLFIDDMAWKTEIPPVKESITDCKSQFVYIWNKDIYPEIKGIIRKDGKYQGPQSGIVIQLIRSKFKDNFLLSGYLSVGISIERPNKDKMIDFVKKIWKILKKTAPKKVAVVNLETHEIINDKVQMLAVGEDAANWCEKDPKRYLKFSNNIHIYLKPL